MFYPIFLKFFPYLQRVKGKCDTVHDPQKANRSTQSGYASETSRWISSADWAQATLCTSSGFWIRSITCAMVSSCPWSEFNGHTDGLTGDAGGKHVLPGDHGGTVGGLHCALCRQVIGHFIENVIPQGLCCQKSLDFGNGFSAHGNHLFFSSSGSRNAGRQRLRTSFSSARTLSLPMPVTSGMPFTTG